MPTCRIEILASVMLIAMCVVARAQSGPLDADPANNRSSRLQSTWQNHKFAPSEATSGFADPGLALRNGGIAAETLSGHGPGCTALSPCAAVSPASSGPLRAAKAAHPRCPEAALKSPGIGMPVICSQCLVLKTSTQL